MSPTIATLSRRGAACLTLLACYSVAGDASAAVFNVNSTVDAVDAVPGNGVCATAGNVCTLRAAVQEANALAGMDDVMLPAGTYALTISGSGENAAATGDLDLTASVRIIGPNAATTIVDASALAARDRVFDVRGGTSRLRRISVVGGEMQRGAGIAVRNANLTVQQAVVADNSALIDGGGIWSDGAGTVLTVLGSEVTQNFAAEHGGGIANTDGSVMTITNSDVTGNDAGDEGGGIYNHLAANAIIETSDISGNAGLGVFSLGGGITNIDASMSIENSTVNNNTAGTGGGIYHFEDTFFTSLETFDVTVSGNEATGSDGGGGIFARFGDVDLNLVEVDDNHATNGDGGGLFLDPESNTMVLRQSTISNNSATGNGGGIAYFGVANSFGNINTSVIHDNLANNGGGLYVQHPMNFQFTVSKNTFSGNEADVNGGGIYLFGLAGSTIDLNFVTIAENDAARGGGIFAQGVAADYDAFHMLLSNNDASIGGAGDNCEGDIDSLGFNLLEYANGCTFNAIASDLVGTMATPINPLLGPLQDNGGPTFTHSFPVNSPPHEAGSVNACSSNDQRNMPAPVNDRCDIGALELQ